MNVLRAQLSVWRQRGLPGALIPLAATRVNASRAMSWTIQDSDVLVSSGRVVFCKQVTMYNVRSSYKADVRVKSNGAV